MNQVVRNRPLCGCPHQNPDGPKTGPCSTSAPGHADNRAQIKPDTTAAYAALRAVAQGQALDQTRVAEFLEDWAPHISCFKDEGEVTLKHAIAALRERLDEEAIRGVIRERVAEYLDRLRAEARQAMAV